MNGVIRADRVHVLQRLRDLRDWARFIHESIRELKYYRVKLFAALYTGGG